MSKEAISLHKKLHGKIFVGSKVSPLSEDQIKNFYTPGVAAVCMEIVNDNKKKYDYTAKSNNVAVITDGTRILGLGNIGSDAALPVMEGKAMLYWEFGKVNAFPICLSVTKKHDIIKTIEAIAPVFGAINLEDIESPKVLDISNELEKRLDIPIFHDDRHGTAVIVLAALINSLKIVGKKIDEVKIVVLGAGSAGYCICQLLSYAGCKKITVLDSKGAIYKKRKGLNKYKQEIAKLSSGEKGSLEEVIAGSDVFIGVSGKSNILKKEMIRKMKKDPIVFALTNPVPEIDPAIAKKSGAKIVATGSYKYPNKVNNALVFPYLMRSILDLGIKKITMDVLYKTAVALSRTVPEKDLEVENIIPKIGDKKLQKYITNSLK